MVAALWGRRKVQ